MIITGDMVLITLLDRRTFVGVGCSSCINVGSVLVIHGSAPGVLFRVCRQCMHFVVIKLLIICRPLGVPAAVSVAVVNSSVSALRCAFGLRLGTWQCCGKSSADPEIRYARVSGTKYKLHL